MTIRYRSVYVAGRNIPPTTYGVAPKRRLPLKWGHPLRHFW